ncbi:alpha beta-hydrolase, partial [Lyophyllum atratum]
DVLAAVKSALSTNGSKKVTIVGHSLGGAIALITSIYLPLHLPSGTIFRIITYGMPRVGNQAFADYIDAHAAVTHINNKKDIVPILPPRFLGFHHSQGEIHIDESNTWNNCPGQDNDGERCTVGDVPNILSGDVSDHNGPYDGVTMDC